MVIHYLPRVIKTILLFALLGFIHSYDAKGQTINNTEDLILKIKNFNYDKQITNLTQQLYVYKGAKIIDYCRSLDVLMIRINRNIQYDDTKMFESLKNAGFLFEIKQDATIEKVQASCRDVKENTIQHQE